jgi:hypothetical protein
MLETLAEGPKNNDFRARKMSQLWRITYWKSMSFEAFIPINGKCCRASYRRKVISKTKSRVSCKDEIYEFYRTTPIYE